MIRRLTLFLLIGGFAVGSAFSVQPGQAQVQRPSPAPVAPFRFEPLGTVDGLSVEFNIRSLLQDEKGFLWIGTLFGLNKYDGYTFKHVVPDLFVDALVEDRQGLFRVGTRVTGLSRLDPATGAVTPYRHDPDDPTSLSSNRITSLHVDHAGTLWIGSEEGGLNRFNTEAGTFTQYRHDPDDPTSLRIDSVRAVYEDRAGILWVGTYGGGSIDWIVRRTPSPDTCTTMTIPLA